MQWRTQAVNIATDIKVKIYFTLPELSTKEIMTWKFHMDVSAKVRYDIILGRDLLTYIGLNPEFSEHVIKTDDEPLKVLTTPIFDLVTY